MKAPRKSKSIARAVTRSHWWGGTGQFYAQEIYKGPISDAHFKNGMHAETFDQKEARTARINLRICGSFVKAATGQIEREEATS